MLMQHEKLSVPAWFKLDRMAHLRDLGASGWAKSLRAVLSLLSMKVENIVEEDGDDISSAIDRLFDEFLSDWLTDPDWSIVRFPIDPQNFRFRGVKALDVQVVARMAATLTRIDGGKEAINCMSAIVDIENGDSNKRGNNKVRQYMRNEDNKKFLHKPFFLAVHSGKIKSDSGKALTPHRAISVNMELPDSILIEDFREWLSATRALALHRAAAKAYTAIDFSRWVDDRYLPLLVLNKWAELVDVKLTYTDMLEAVYPDRPRVTSDNVRRTILPGARAWACQEIVLALEAQAAKESGEFLSARRRGRKLPKS